MLTENFEVANVKCGGCATTIEEGLLALVGVNGVRVNVESGQVEVSGDGLKREQVQKKLADLGYPVC